MTATRHRISGLVVESQVGLPELPLAEAVADARSPDLHVGLGPWRAARGDPSGWRTLWMVGDGVPWLRYARLPDGYLLRFPGLADFALSGDGRRVEARPRRATLPETVRHLLLDQVLPLALSLQGRHALHATAVLTPAGVCAFTGPAGAGKSTLAGSFLLGGYPVVSDDCLALSAAGARVEATPAYPGLRLWEDSLQALGTRIGGTVAVAHYTSKKRVLPMPDAARPPDGPSPLARVYRVVRPEAANGHGSEQGNGHGNGHGPGGANGHAVPGASGSAAAPRIEPLTPRDALVELVRSSFVLDVDDRETQLRLFRFLERVVERVPVRRLVVPDRFDALPAVREAILADLADPAGAARHAPA